MAQTQGLVGASGGATLATALVYGLSVGATPIEALACGLVSGAFYCLHRLWAGKARARHKVLLALCCCFLTKMPVLLARGGGRPGEGVHYSGLAVKGSQSGDGEGAHWLQTQEWRKGPPTPPPFLIPGVTTAPTGLASFNSTMEASDSSSSHVALLVLSAPANFRKRAVLRKLRMVGFRLHFFFLIGQSENRTLQRKLEKESQLHDDILQLSVTDSYRALPMKTLGGMEHLLSQERTYDLVIKVDDDLEISEANLAKALSTTRPWQEDTLYCYHLKNISPNRNPWNSKFYVSYSTYPYMSYPDYCLGWVWVARPATLQALIQQVPKSPPVHVDDIYITGILRQGTNISLSMLSSSSFYHSALHTHLTSHCTFLSWALHIYAFDLAHEPEGWPWQPVKGMILGVHETLRALLTTTAGSSGDLVAQGAHGGGDRQGPQCPVQYLLAILWKPVQQPDILPGGEERRWCTVDSDQCTVDHIPQGSAVEGIGVYQSSKAEL